MTCCRNGWEDEDEPAIPEVALVDPYGRPLPAAPLAAPVVEGIFGWRWPPAARPEGQRPPDSQAGTPEGATPTLNSSYNTAEGFAEEAPAQVKPAGTTVLGPAAASACACCPICNTRRQCRQLHQPPLVALLYDPVPAICT